MKTSFCIIIIVLLKWIEETSTSPVTVTVRTNLGEIEGTTSESYLKGRTYYTFLGVPYARPPVGKNRFKEPQPVKPWKGTLKANTVYKCMQYDHLEFPGQVVGDEDCLYINIYTPDLDPNAKLDVIAYIHGGAFMFHYGAYQGAEYLLDKNLVYVNFNYRLGPLGFLSTEDAVVPGNNGIRDQIMALKWIQENIANFGGNPESVTIVGCSAGGASVHLHYLSEKSRGLFHRGISISGTALNPWVLMEEPLQTTRKVSANIGCPTDGRAEMVECLKLRSARQIVSSVKELQPFLYNPFSPFGVVVDSSWSSDPVLRDHPYNLLKRGEVADLPWIISYTNGEGLYPGFELYDDQYLQEIDSRWIDIIPFILHYNTTVDPNARDWVSQKIRQFYLGDKKVSKETFPDLLHILSDRLFVADIGKAGRLQAAVTKSPVYVYHFTYKGNRSIFDNVYGAEHDFGASHADDIGFIFKTTTPTRSKETDAQIGELLINVLDSFAQSGDPKIGVEWPPLSRKSTDPFLHLKIAGPDNLVVEAKDVVGNRTFWDSLPLRENEKLFEVKDEL